MEKTIEIDGKQVRFKSTGALPVRYKSQFGRDFFKDLYKMQAAVEVKNKKKPTMADIEKLDFDTFYKIIWVLAKTADPKIPQMEEWLDSFGEFPMMYVLDEVMEMIESSIEAKKK